MSDMLMLDFSELIADRTRDFIGREWVFDEIEHWLAAADTPRIFLLTGAPGSGKTAVAARLVKMSLGEVAANPYPHLGRDALACFHFCQANNDATLDPLRFVEALSRALANRYDAFRDALLKTGDRDITVNATQYVTTAAGGSQVRNVVINELRIGALSARSAFDRVVRSPLEALVTSGFDQALIVLVDSLDEALTFGDENLVTLLEHTGDLPQMRFILTGRPDKRITAALGERTLDLIDDAPSGVDDVCTYVEARLRMQEDPLRLDFARRVAEASKGSFLYARYKLDEAIPRLDKGEAPSAIALPSGLDGIYREFLKRELASNLDTWEERYRPVLGLLAVARGNGLTADQIARISQQKRSQTDTLLRRCEQYLAGPDDKGRLRIYHQSYRDFLLQDADFQVYPDEANASIADWYWTSCFDQAAGRHTWGSCDEYGLTNLPVHLAEADRKADLHSLLLDYHWLQAKLDRLGINALLADFVVAQPATDDAARELSRALEQGAYVLAQNSAQLAPQLLGRLLDEDAADIQALLAQTRTQGQRPCLLPQNASLQKPHAMTRVLSGHAAWVNGLAMSRDGRLAVSAAGDSHDDDNTLKVWELASGRELRSLRGHGAAVRAVALTQDGQLAVSASDDCTLKIWELQTGRELRTLRGHASMVFAVALTPDGLQAVSASRDKNLIVWDLMSGHKVHILQGHTRGVRGVAVTPDGRRIISASSDTTLKVWDRDTGREMRTLYGHQGRVRSVVVTPDGRYAISASDDRTLKVWDLESGSELRTLSGHADSVRAVAVTPDGKLAVSASYDNTLRIWQLESGQEVQTLPGHAGGVRAVVLTPDGQQAISASRDKTLMVWDLTGGRGPHTRQGRTELIRALTVTPSGHLVLSASDDCTVKVWDLASHNELRTLQGHAERVNAVAVTPNGQLIISASSDKSLKVWNSTTAAEPRTLRGHGDEVHAVAVLPGDRRVISGSSDKSLKVWDIRTGRELRTLWGHTAQVNAVAATPDGRRAISASDDCTIKVWDLEVGRDLRTLQGHNGSVLAVAVTADGQHVVSASQDTTLKVWEMETGLVVRTLEGHTNWVRAVTLSHDGRLVVSASRDGTIRVWELVSGHNVASFVADGGLHACATARDNASIVAGGDSGRVHFLSFEQ